MANPILGEVEKTIDGTTYKLVLDVNAWCEIENLFDDDFSSRDILQKLGTGNMKLLRAVLWGALRTFHPDIALVEAGRLATLLGPANAQRLLMDVAMKAFPKPEEGEASAEAGKDPQKKEKTGIGKPS